MVRGYIDDLYQQLVWAIVKTNQRRGQVDWAGAPQRAILSSYGTTSYFVACHL